MSINICVAGMGRCGATMLTNYLAKKLNTVTGIHKREFVEYDGKVIFIFGNPYNSVLSFSKMTLKPIAFKRLGGNYERRNNYLNEDVFNLEGLFDDWYRRHEFDLVSVRYETLWNNLTRLGDYLGLDLDDFPKYTERKTDWTTYHDKKQLQKTYGRLYNKVRSAKDFKIW